MCDTKFFFHMEKTFEFTFMSVEEALKEQSAVLAVETNVHLPCQMVIPRQNSLKYLHVLF